MSTTCEHHERVSAYASGEADAILEAHLPGCVSCRAELAASRALLGALGQLRRDDDDQPTVDLVARVRAEVTRPAPRRRWWLVAAPLAVAAAIVAVAMLRSPAPASRPPEQARVTVPDPPPVADEADDAAEDDLELTDGPAIDPLAAVDDLADEDLDAALARL
jgi:anti-sigma factor RsiW